MVVWYAQSEKWFSKNTSSRDQKQFFQDNEQTSLSGVTIWNQFLQRMEERKMNLMADDLLHRSLIFHKAQDKTWLFSLMCCQCVWTTYLTAFTLTKHFMQKEKNKIQIWRNIRPGSTDPRATTESKPTGAFFKVWSSLVMVCSLPRATSHRNITPVFLEVLTKKQDTTWWRSVPAQQPLPPTICVRFFGVFF